MLSGRTNADLNEPQAVREDHKRRSEIVAARRIKLPELLNVKGARKALLRLFVGPSLASPADKPPNGDKWRHEIKFDGYRIQARVDSDEVRLLTRKGLDWTSVSRASPARCANSILALRYWTAKSWSRTQPEYQISLSLSAI